MERGESFLLSVKVFSGEVLPISVGRPLWKVLFRSDIIASDRGNPTLGRSRGPDSGHRREIVGHRSVTSGLAPFL